MHRYVALFASLLTLAALLPDDAEARRRRGVNLGPGLKRGQSFVGPVLTAAELRACVQLQDRINAANDALEADAAQIEFWRSSLDRTNPSLVQNFNALVATYNDKVEMADLQVRSFNQECAGKSYYESDMGPWLHY